MEELNSVKPKVLKVVSVLSFVYIGFHILTMLVGLIYGKPTEEILLDKKVKSIEMASGLTGTLKEAMVEAAELTYQISLNLNPNFYLNIIVSLLTLLIGLTGVVLMNRKNKLGFHLYIVYSLVLIGKVYLFLPTSLISFESITVQFIISGVLIFLYSKTLSWMK